MAPAGMKLWHLGLFLFLLLLATGCGEEGDEGTVADDQVAAANATLAASSERTVPTLYPTFTRAAQAATATPQRMATATAGPTVDFEQELVSFRYTIPALGLDRRLEGNVNGRVTLVDESTGIAVMLQNQSAVLLELQQALPELELAPLPGGCDRCVAFSYELAISGESGEGWLQDPVMLASVENYTALHLGPHFPPGTLVGLHRTATAYDVAHSVALTADGLLYRWLATEVEVAAPLPAGEVDAALLTAAEQVAPEELNDEYTANCRAVPIETLFLNLPGQQEANDDGREGRYISLLCPAFSLPRSLLPLYVRLDALMEPLLVVEGVARPPTAIPLSTLLDYQRADRARLTLLLEGEAIGVDPGGERYTETISNTQVLSLTTSLRDSEALRPGVEAFAAGEGPNILLVRGAEGMLEASWEGEPPQAMRTAIAELNRLLDRLLGLEVPTEEEISPLPEGTSTGTALPGTPTATLEATLTPEASETPAATATP